MCRKMGKKGKREKMERKGTEESVMTGGKFNFRAYIDICIYAFSRGRDTDRGMSPRVARIPLTVLLKSRAGKEDRKQEVLGQS